MSSFDLSKFLPQAFGKKRKEVCLDEELEKAKRTQKRQKLDDITSSQEAISAQLAPLSPSNGASHAALKRPDTPIPFVGPPRPPSLMGPPRPRSLQPQQQAKPATEQATPTATTTPADATPASIAPKLVGPPRPPGLVGPPRPPNLSSIPSSRAEMDAPATQATRTTHKSDQGEEVNEGSPVSADDTTAPVRYTYTLPISHEIILRGHTKAISALALDPSGSRLLTGSLDYQLRLYDFAGMTTALRAFRTLEPIEGHPVISACYSPSGDRFVVSCGSTQPKIYDRDGSELDEFVKGDMYLTDMANTKGHVAKVTAVAWHPSDKDTILTGSHDGTVRLWDVDDVSKRQRDVIKTKTDRGMRVGITTATYSPADGRWIGAGCQDGSLQVWDVGGGGPLSRPTALARGAHNGDIASIAFGRDGRTLISRGTGSDDSLKVWDLRALKSPLKVFSELPSFYEQTDCVFSPDDQLIVTGTSVKIPKKNTFSSDNPPPSGRLVFIDKKLLVPVQSIALGPGVSAVRVQWHSKINQIVVGASDGATRVLFSPELSNKGALLATSRAPRAAEPDDWTPDRPVFSPNALPVFKERMAVRRRIQDGSKPKPEKPEQIGAAPPRIGSSLTQHLMKGLMKDTSRDEDPREALLRYAREAEENPVFFKVYKETQPTPVLDYEGAEEEARQEAEKEKKKQRQPW